MPNFDYDDTITRVPIRILLHVQYYPWSNIAMHHDTVIIPEYLIAYC